MVIHVKLKVVQGRPYGKFLVFAPGEYYFGRGLECHVRPDSEWVSRQHCLLRVTADAAYIRDLSSRNGTLVNGVLIRAELELTTGDQIQIGPLVLEVSLHAAPDEPHVPGDADTVDHTPPSPGEQDSERLSNAGTHPELELPPIPHPEKTEEPPAVRYRP